MVSSSETWSETSCIRSLSEVTRTTSSSPSWRRARVPMTSSASNPGEAQEGDRRRPRRRARSGASARAGRPACRAGCPCTRARAGRGRSRPGGPRSPPGSPAARSRISLSSMLVKPNRALVGSPLELLIPPMAKKARNARLGPSRRYSVGRFASSDMPQVWHTSSPQLPHPPGEDAKAPSSAKTQEADVRSPVIASGLMPRGALVLRTNSEERERGRFGSWGPPRLGRPRPAAASARQQPRPSGTHASLRAVVRCRAPPSAAPRGEAPAHVEAHPTPHPLAPVSDPGARTSHHLATAGADLARHGGASRVASPATCLEARLGAAPLRITTLTGISAPSQRDVVGHAGWPCFAPSPSSAWPGGLCLLGSVANLKPRPNPGASRAARSRPRARAHPPGKSRTPRWSTRVGARFMLVAYPLGASKIRGKLLAVRR